MSIDLITVPQFCPTSLLMARRGPRPAFKGNISLTKVLATRIQVPSSRNELHRCSIDVVFDVLDTGYRPALVDERDLLPTFSIHGSALFIHGVLCEALEPGQIRFFILQTNCQVVAVSFIGELLVEIDRILFGRFRGKVFASTSLIAIRECSRSDPGNKILEAMDLPTFS